MSNKKRRYPYLSIDQIQRSFNQTNVAPNSTLSSFFNIKFDIRGERSTDRLNLAPSNSKQTQITKVQPFFSNEEKQKEYDRVYFLAKSGKKRHSAEKMLESITKIIEKEAADKKVTNQSIKKKFKTQEVQSSEYLKHEMPQNHEVYVLPMNHLKPKQIFQKGKHMSIHKMLKKCSQLKQIQRVEIELTKNANISKQLPCIRFNTQPVSLAKYDKDIKDKIYTPKKPNINKKLFQKNTTPQTPQQHQKTLQIRRYNNQSVIKNRLKHMIKRQRLQIEQRRVSEIMGFEKKTFKKTCKAKTCQSEEKDFVGPWNELPQQECQFK